MALTQSFVKIESVVSNDCVIALALSGDKAGVEIQFFSLKIIGSGMGL